MEDNYIVIYCSEDGDAPSIVQMNGEALRKRLKENYWGSRPGFANELGDLDTGYFIGLVIIKGKIVKPKPTEVAIDYDL